MAGRELPGKNLLADLRAGYVCAREMPFRRRPLTQLKPGVPHKTMSNSQYRKHCCPPESCAPTSHRYVSGLADHEKFIENLSKLSLRQACAAPQRPSCPPAPRLPQPCAKNETRVRHRVTTRATASKKGDGRANSAICYPLPRRPTSSVRCGDDFVWQTGKYVRDECGSGIVPLRQSSTDPRRLWCKTPLTMYQSTIGELARQMLCKEIVVPKRVNDGPPCNLCERVMPLCRGYYRKYECRRSCEEDHAVVKNGKKVYRDAIQRYWMPCLTAEEKRAYDLSKDADHNVYLGKKLKRKIDDKLTCW